MRNKIKYLLLLSCTIFSFKVNKAQISDILSDFQHTGAIHIYAEEGDLEIVLSKKDLPVNSSIDRTNVIYLTGPDGTVLKNEKLLSSPGYRNNEETMQQVKFQILVEQAGVYTLFITSNNDQYLRRSQLWTFSTNAKKYMFNSSAGHVDGAREEPIILRGGTKPISVFFKPRTKKISVLLDHLPVTSGKIELRDANAKIVWESESANAKIESGDIENQTGGIWELRLPQSRANILIHGLNSKFQPDANQLPVWTTSKSAYFDIDEINWLLQPRRYAKQAEPFDQGVIEFTVYNNKDKSGDFHLSTQVLQEFSVKLKLDKEKLRLGPGAHAKVKVYYELQEKADDKNYSFNIICKDEESQKQAYSLVEMRLRENKLENKIEIPLQLKIFGHDQFQFAYEPNYPTENQFYFDTDNRPWVITSDGLRTLIKDKWIAVQIPGYDPKDINFPITVIGTDSHGNVYTIASLAKKPHLISASAKNMQANLVELPVRGAYSIETNFSQKDKKQPPAILCHSRNRNLLAIGKWSSPHQVSLFLPEIKNGKLILSDKIDISENGIGVSLHSGIPNSIVSTDDKVYVLWGETSDPKLKHPGVPVYLASYNRNTKEQIERDFIGYAPPVNDGHNTSSVLMDEQQIPHIIIAAHNRPFFYRKAISGGDKFSVPQQISKYDQTYVGAFIDMEGAIHLFYRIWQRGEDFPEKYDAALYYQTKPKNGKWTEPKPFVLPALPGYSVYRHRVTMDRLGNLLVNLEYWSTWTAYRNMSSVHTKSNKLTIISKDKGQTWSVLTDKDFKLIHEKE